MPIMSILSHIVLYIPYASKFSIFLKFRDYNPKNPPWIRHCMRMPGVGKGKDADFVLCQDVSGTSKRGEAGRDRGRR